MELVSVVIPTYNSSRTIENCLISIHNQDYPNIEIIVVDNFSTDSTFEIAEKYADLPLQKWPERTAQKNLGIQKASGKYICFIDSDMSLAPDVISECVALFESSKNIGGIAIPEKTVGEGFFVKVRDFERSFYTGTDIESARFFLAEDVRKVWGFEEDLIFFEESLLPQKIEKLGKSTKNAIKKYIAHDESNITLGKWLKKKYYYGRSMNQYKKRVREIGVRETVETQTRVIPRVMIFLWNKNFYTHPILAISTLGLKGLEFWSWAVGLLTKR